MIYDKGSFRDPAGRVFYKSNRIFREIFDQGKKRVNFIIKNEVLKDSVDKNFLIDSKLLDEQSKKTLNLGYDSMVFEHKKIPFISYPYEWSFFQLKDAALHHLDFHSHVIEGA